LLLRYGREEGGLLIGISAAPWVARRLGTNYFEIHFKLSWVDGGFTTIQLRRTKLGIIYKFT